MNELIKKLANKAWLLAHEANDQAEEDEGEELTETEFNNVFQRKFAELIVQECLSYAKDGDLDFMKFMIKKHFGVEE